MTKVYKNVLELRKDFPSLDKCARAYVVPSRLDLMPHNLKQVDLDQTAYWVLAETNLSEYPGQALFIGIKVAKDKRAIYAGVISGLPIKQKDGRYVIPVKYVNNKKPICTVEGGGITAFYAGTAPQTKSPVSIKNWSPNKSSDLLLMAGNFDVDTYDELVKIDQDSSIESTIKEQLILARVGQGKFRNSVLVRAEYCCDVTGFNEPGLLLASHILPWVMCKTKDERLDANNGLLLTPNLDRLFDRGFIGFDDSGEMLVKESFWRDLQRIMPSVFLDEHHKLRNKPSRLLKYLPIMSTGVNAQTL